MFLNRSKLTNVWKAILKGVSQVVRPVYINGNKAFQASAIGIRWQVASSEMTRDDVIKRAGTQRVGVPSVPGTDRRQTGERPGTGRDSLQQLEATWAIGITEGPGDWGTSYSDLRTKYSVICGLGFLNLNSSLRILVLRAPIQLPLWPREFDHSSPSYQSVRWRNKSLKALREVWNTLVQDSSDVQFDNLAK